VITHTNTNNSIRLVAFYPSVHAHQPRSFQAERLVLVHDPWHVRQPCIMASERAGIRDLSTSLRPIPRRPQSIVLTYPPVPKKHLLSC